jgi:protein-S-isoprenylcysteine O-methyltransferase Ste14
MSALTRKAFLGLLCLFAVMTALLFATAGTLDYWQAWVYLTVYFAASLAITLDLVRNNPELLARRMRGGPSAEKRPAQRLIMWLASAGFIFLIVVPALDRRFGWSHLSSAVALAGDGLMVLGWVGIFLVFRANSFAAATIETAPDQRVISTGPYALVRHPMYATALVMLLGIPLALGSLWGVLVLAAILPALVWRLLDEETFLARNLQGYIAYKDKVRYRLVPGIW